MPTLFVSSNWNGNLFSAPSNAKKRYLESAFKYWRYFREAGEEQNKLKIFEEYLHLCDVQFWVGWTFNFDGAMR